MDERILSDLTLSINQERLMTEIDALSQFSDVPAPAVTRILYSPMDMAARTYIKQLVDEAGFSWREDPMGNFFVNWIGSEPDLPAVATGSHTDAIPFSGRYDGVVGVLGGLEAMRALKESGYAPKHTIQLIMFTAEEPTRFGVGCLGSRTMAGLYSVDELLALTDDEGASFDDVRKAAGYSGSLDEVVIDEGTYAYFVELHIEQGPRLEIANIKIGIVTAIAASSTIRVTISGDGGHAGAVLMPIRRDALAAAAELALFVETTAKENESPDAVATVGIFEVHPGASNSIPSRVQMTIDVRDKEMMVRDVMMGKMSQALEEIAKRRGVEVDFDVLNWDPSAQSDPAIVDAATAAATKLGYSHTELISRAYHDTVFMGQNCPVAMIFIPSKDGYSHRPEEYSSPQEIVQGVEVLALTLAQLAS